MSEASGLIVNLTREVSAVRSEGAQLRTWLRAAMRTLIDQNREIDRLRADLQRERQQHRDLMESILLGREAA